MDCADTCFGIRKGTTDRNKADSHRCKNATGVDDKTGINFLKDWDVNNARISLYRSALRSSSVLVAAATIAVPAFAQEQETAESVEETIIVTGSRIARPNMEANSPITVMTGEDTVKNADITLDTFLNTLPQVNPAGTTTSNNPGNGGQSNINLRGLGANRNIVLIDGRRPMVSQTDQTVDLNTIPQQLIERIEVVTGGAGATYGADAIAGVVNMRLKDNFEGIDLRATYSNSVPKVDAREYQISGVIGANIADGRGNVTFSAEYSKRQGLIKSQRAYAEQATSTTTTPPTGRYVASAANLPTPEAIAAVFGTYGVTGDQLPMTPSLIGFNSDGTLFGAGTFNNPNDVANFRYDISSGARPNLNFFPDFYSYNFDAINLLVLPMERKSAFMRAHYEISPSFEFFTQAGYTEYQSANALAPTPVGTTIENPTTNTRPTRATSSLVEPGRTITGLIAPITNPFVPADLLTILNSRTGDDPALTGTGAAEGIRINKRFLDTGLRESQFDNRVIQGLAGLRGNITDNWRYEAYYSWGRTTIDVAATGNVHVQRVQELLEAPDGGVSLCEGGFNPFGIHPLSADCIDYIDETGYTKTTFTQKIAQAYVQGDLVELPAGALSVVLGLEQRKFRYAFDPGVLSGPIAGFNTATPDLGTNKFTDFFAEALIPIASGAPWADQLEVSLGYRYSKSDFNDIQNGIDGDSVGSDAYKIDLTWAPVREARFRASYQRSVRAPNFGELFSGGGSFPQYFDPCSATTVFRQSGAAAADLCTATGALPGYQQTPGSQAFLGINGNPNLKPEKSDTITAGVVFQKWGFTGSIDYYNIKIKDPIFAPDPNLMIAACYGYHGINPSLDASNVYCDGTFARTPDIAQVVIPEELGGDGSYFLAINQGKIKTSGVDVQLGYSLPTDVVSERSSISANLYLNYLIDFKVQELPGVTLDYADTVSYFGQGLGTSFPRWKGNLNLAWQFDAITLSSRIRYIDGMKNRAAVQFPGEEASFTGVNAVWYFDFAAQVNVDALTFRIGVNNAFNKAPPIYSPNVQSGTDPSLYDVIGRRAYVTAGLKF